MSSKNENITLSGSKKKWPILARKIFDIIFLILICCKVEGQEPAYKNYTTSDGLASINVYSAVQDDEGFMWFATDNGVSRFDGTHFKNFSIADGLTDNTTLKIAKDASGRLWFLSFNGKLCYYEKGKIYNKSNSNLLKKIALTSSPSCFFVDSEKNVWIGSLNGVVIKISDSVNVKTYNNIPAQDIWEDKTGDIKLLSRGQIFTFHDSIFTVEKIPASALAYLVKHLPGDTSMLIVDKNSLITSNLRGNILMTKSFRNYTQSYIQGISIDNYDNTWVSTIIGVKEFDKSIFDTPHEHDFFTDYSITFVFQDKENNLWFTSLGKGVFMIPSLRSRLFNSASGLSEDNISSICILNDSVWMAGTQNGSIQLIENGFIKSKKRSIVIPSGYVLGIEKDERDNIWILTNMALIKYNKKKFDRITPYNAWFKSFYIAKDGTIWIGQGLSISKLEGNKIKTVYHGDLNRIYSITEFSGNEMWLGTEKGLYRLSNGKMIEVNAKDSLLHRRINSLAVTNDSTLWIATDGYGLLSYKNGIVKSYTKENHLLSNHCNSLLVEGGVLYLATDNGLNVINTGYKLPVIKSYSSANGLISDHINRVVRKKEHELLLATDRGIIEMDENNLSPPSSSTPYINSILINDRNADISILTHLRYNEGNISIEFGAINYNANENSSFRYRLSGTDSSWSYTNSHTVKYINLLPGAYKFELSSQDAAGNWSASTASFSFFIETPWWQTWWFRAICIISGIIVLSIIIRWRIKVYNKKLEQQKYMAESELKALRAQINPHFIYNSLNSIQDFIMENQKQDANLYLAKFAKLMRSILSHSRLQKISLAEEIESLTLYLELESLRFNNRFRFTFEIDPDINIEDILIPSMILQPYVENAILHGLSAREEGGKLKISFYKKDSNLVCTIEDNGIGRKRAAEIRQQKLRKGGKSLGMKITGERIDLLNFGERQKINLEIADLEDEKNNTCGTRVTVFFPLT